MLPAEKPIDFGRRGEKTVDDAELSQTRMAAEFLLERMHANGVRYLFANAGTDFAPIVESLAAASGGPAIETLLVPHENIAVAMAHGHAMVSGRPQAVMLHVNVGTANGLCGIMNASRSETPMLVMAGCSPITENRAPEAGARDRFIHWAQDMFDQGGMVREFVKWDYELRAADEVEATIDRALALAQTAPKGPVYLTLPREVLGTRMAPRPAPKPRAAASPAQADPAALDRAAEILRGAENPLIVTADVGRDPAAVAPLGALAEAFAIPVIPYLPRHMCLPSDHPMLLDYDSGPHVGAADAILVLDCDVPWIPSLGGPAPDAKIIHLGTDPLYRNYPVRGFPCDLAITADSAIALPALAAAMAHHGDASRIEARRRRVAATRGEIRARWRAADADMATGAPIAPAWVSRCLAGILGENGIQVSEMGPPLSHANLVNPGTYFSTSPVSGLGWAMGASLGAKLAAPDRLVVATIGDGSYYFSNPTAAHYCARAHDLPVLTVVLNNSSWGAVRRATRAMYPGGAATRMNQMPLTALEPMVAFERVIEACGGHGERVEDAAALPAALARAVHAVRVERKPALLNVVCAAP
jgi:acetolactate synthase-1/2/3 large subunit